MNLNQAVINQWLYCIYLLIFYHIFIIYQWWKLFILILFFWIFTLLLFATKKADRIYDTFLTYLVIFLRLFVCYLYFLKINYFFAAVVSGVLISEGAFVVSPAVSTPALSSVTIAAALSFETTLSLPTDTMK